MRRGVMTDKNLTLTRRNDFTIFYQDSPKRFISMLYGLF